MPSAFEKPLNSQIYCSNWTAAPGGVLAQGHHLCHSRKYMSVQIYTNKGVIGRRLTNCRGAKCRPVNRARWLVDLTFKVQSKGINDMLYDYKENSHTNIAQWFDYVKQKEAKFHFYLSHRNPSQHMTQIQTFWFERYWQRSGNPTPSSTTDATSRFSIDLDQCQWQLDTTMEIEEIQ